MHRRLWEKALSATASILVNIRHLNYECRAIRLKIPVFVFNYALHLHVADRQRCNALFRVGCVPKAYGVHLQTQRCLFGHHVQWHTIGIKIFSEEWFPTNQRMSGTKNSFLSPRLCFHLPVTAARMIPTDMFLVSFLMHSECSIVYQFIVS